MDYTYDAVVKDVHDGDTITVDVDLGLETWIHGMKLRLFGLNAPELITPAGKVAQTFLAQKLPIGGAVVIQTQKDKQEKFGRWLATVLKDGVDVNASLIASGNAKAWDGHGVRPV